MHLLRRCAMQVGALLLVTCTAQTPRSTPCQRLRPPAMSTSAYHFQGRSRRIHPGDLRTRRSVSPVKVDVGPSFVNHQVTLTTWSTTPKSVP
ncbi:unnamed protein product [Closterium sp. NIES-54]